MSQYSLRFWEVFFELFETLPRQGPGSRQSTQRALSLCVELPEHPIILDMGCGTGAQTLHLAELTAGQITAIDAHTPFVAILEQRIEAKGLGERVQAVVADMAAFFPPQNVDLIWCEGAAYFLGVERALTTWRPLLRPGGYLAFTEAVWLTTDPSPEARETWIEEYPSMSDVQNAIAIATKCGFEICGHFTMPQEDWWEDFYTPMVQGVHESKVKYAQDSEALEALERIGRDIEMHRNHGQSYGYEFFVLRV